MMTKEQKELAKEIEKLSKSESDDKSDKKDDKKSEKVEDIVVELEGIEDRILRLTPSSSNLGYATQQGWYRALLSGCIREWNEPLEA